MVSVGRCSWSPRASPGRALVVSVGRPRVGARGLRGQAWGGCSWSLWASLGRALVVSWSPLAGLGRVLVVSVGGRSWSPWVSPGVNARGLWAGPGWALMSSFILSLLQLSLPAARPGTAAEQPGNLVCL